MIRSLGIAVCALGLWTAANAQPAERKEPARYVGTDRASRFEARPPGVRLGLRRPRELALAPLSGSESQRLAAPGPRLRTGLHRALPDEALGTGAWETTTEGVRVWRMSIRSPGSEGIRVEFRNFDAGSGKVWLYDGALVAGPYTGTGLFDNGRFWSGTVASETVTLEYEPGPDRSGELAPPFEIARISHQQKAIDRRASVRKTAISNGTQEGTSDPADYCHLDPNCYPEWQETMSSVANLLFEEDGDQYLCSGSLVATRDNSFKPYLLTAGHCINSEEAARSLQVFWRYQTGSCGSQPPTSRMDAAKTSSLGGHLVEAAGIENGDYSLVLLKEVPAGVTFSGWDAGDPPMGTPLTGLHHPAGSWKRISFGERIADQTVVIGDSLAPGERYLDVLWSKGRTEPGSSGSPLFSSPGVIVGTLTYGPVADGLTACQIEPSQGGYGRFSNTYQHLKNYLENLPAALVLPAERKVAFTVKNGSAPAAHAVRLTTESSGEQPFKLRADAPWIVLSQAVGTLSAKSPATVGIGIDPSFFDQPGEYASTVAISSNAADPQYINVTAVVRVEQSGVTASINPNPVKQENGLWTFQITLEENGGTTTRLTGFKVNSRDYTSQIEAFFGARDLSAYSVLRTALQAKGFAPGVQYFEFWGTDEATGKTWYRVATADFQ